MPGTSGRDDVGIFAANDGGKKGRNFKVVVRVRPTVDREQSFQDCVTVNSNHAITIRKPQEGSRVGRPTSARPGTASGRTEEQHFAYDRVFHDASSQDDIYQQACKPIVLSVLEGYNGTILAYGQTGTGKTYTMEGASQGDDRGIIPRAATEIFQYIQDDKPAHIALENGKRSQWLVRCSFLQIYNEKINDLLQGESNELKIRERGDGEIYVESLSEHVVRGPRDIYELLRLGRAQRNTNSTKMNAASSRSHAVFTIIVEHSSEDPTIGEGYSDVTVGKLHLVDLAGSERYEVTTEAKHQQETVDINRSLSAFGKVVLALTSRGSQHIPYRESKLTRILQDSLGGNSKTTMISTISPSSFSYLESTSTLKFANRAKNVKNVAQVNKDVSESAMLSAMQSEIRRLQAELENKHKEATPVSNDEMLRMQEQSKKSQLEKSVIVSELAKRQREVLAAQRERDAFCKKIEELQGQLVSGGTQVEETEEFKAALAKELSKREQEEDQRRSEFEEERKKLAAEKAKFEEERRSFAALAHAAHLATSLASAGRGAAAVPGTTPEGTTIPHPPKATGSPDVSPTAPKFTPRPPSGHVHRRSSTGGMGGSGAPSGLFSQRLAHHARRRVSCSTATPTALSSAMGGVAPGSGGVAGESCSGASSANNSPAFDRRVPGPPRPAFRLHSTRSPPAGAVSPPGVDSLLSSEDSDGEDAPTDGDMYDRGTGGRGSVTNGGGPLQGRRSYEPPPGPPPTRGKAPMVRRNTEPVLMPMGGGGMGHGADVAEDRMADAREPHIKTPQEEALEQYSRALQHPETGIPLGSRRVRLTTYRLCFSGADAAGWFMANMEGIHTPQQATDVGQQLLDLGIIVHVRQAKQFTVSDTDLFQFRKVTELAQGNVGENGSPSGLRGLLHRRNSATSVSRSSLASSKNSLSRSSLGTSRLSVSSIRSDNSLSSVARGLMDTSGGAEEYVDASSSPLHIAAARGEISTIRSLLGRIHIDEALMYGVIGNRAKACKFLIKNNANANARDDNGNTPLMWAACRGCPDSMKELLKLGADVAAADSAGNKRDDELLSPLHWAVMCEHPKHVEALLNSEADPVIGDNEGRTALHYAVSRNALQSLTVMLEYCRHTINVPDANGRTALHAACAEGSMEALRMLLETPGIDVSATDQRLTTPLHWAAVCNRVEHCTMLLQHGARLMARDASGLSALHYATEKGYLECASVLQRHGTSTSATRPMLSATSPPQYGATAMAAYSPTGGTAARARVPSARDMWRPRGGGNSRGPTGGPTGESRGSGDGVPPPYMSPARPAANSTSV